MTMKGLRRIWRAMVGEGDGVKRVERSEGPSRRVFLGTALAAVPAVTAAMSERAVPTYDPAKVVTMPYLEGCDGKRAYATNMTSCVMDPAWASDGRLQEVSIVRHPTDPNTKRRE